MLRRTVLGSLTLSFLLALGGTALAGGKGGGGGTTPPPNPEILFVEKTSKNMFLRVMNADGTNARTVLTVGKYDHVSPPRWSPNGGRLAFVGTLSGVQGLWRVNLDGTGLARILPFTYSTMELDDVDWARTVAPDGWDKILLLRSYDGSPLKEVLALNPDGSGLQTLYQTTDDLWSACWNREATAVVLTRSTVDENNVTHHYVQMEHVDVAPGGGLTVTGETVIPIELPGVRISLATANTRDLFAHQCLWGATPDIQTLDLSVSPPAITSLTNGGESTPSYSPDDMRLAYERDGSIYTCAADGTGETRIRAATSTTKTFYPFWRHN